MNTISGDNRESILWPVQGATLPTSPIADPYVKEVVIMGKIVECAKVDPSSGCKHVVRGQTEEEVLKNAAEHAKQHGIRELTPELKAKVKTSIRDE